MTRVDAARSARPYWQTRWATRPPSPVGGSRDRSLRPEIGPAPGRSRRVPSGRRAGHRGMRRTRPRDRPRPDVDSWSLSHSRIAWNLPAMTLDPFVDRLFWRHDGQRQVIAPPVRRIVRRPHEQVVATIVDRGRAETQQREVGAVSERPDLHGRSLSPDGVVTPERSRRVRRPIRRVSGPRIPQLGVAVGAATSIRLDDWTSPWRAPRSITELSARPRPVRTVVPRRRRPRDDEASWWCRPVVGRVGVAGSCVRWVRSSGWIRRVGAVPAMSFGA